MLKITDLWTSWGRFRGFEAQQLGSNPDSTTDHKAPTKLPTFSELACFIPRSPPSLHWCSAVLILCSLRQYRIFGGVGYSDWKNKFHLNFQDEEVCDLVMFPRIPYLIIAEPGVITLLPLLLYQSEVSVCLFLSLSLSLSHTHTHTRTRTQI